MSNKNHIEKINTNTYIMQVKAKDYFEKLTQSKDSKVNFNDLKNNFTGSIPDSLELMFLKKEHSDEFYTDKSKKGLSTMRSNLIIDVSFKDDFKETVTKKSHYKKSKRGGYSVTFETGDGNIIKTKLQMRKDFYLNGFDVYINGAKTHFVFYERGSNKVKAGQVLFIQEKAFKKVNKWALMDLKFSKTLGLKLKLNKIKLAKKKTFTRIKADKKKTILETTGEDCDITSLFAYRALTTSGIIGTVEIKPNEILLIDDFKSEFSAWTSVTEYDKKLKKLVVTEREQKQDSDIWDGQSLIDASKLSGDFQGKGCILLRQKFLKSCAFSTNIQKWFKDNNITNVSQLKGITTASKIEDIKLILTPNSLKALKFGYKLGCSKEQEKEMMFEYWLEHTEDDFGIVKYEKPSQLETNENGQVMNRLSYQMFNTLDLSTEDINDVLKYSINHIMNIKNDFLTFKKYLYKNKHDDCTLLALSEICEVNPDVQYTKLYSDKKAKVVENLRDDLLQGHVIVPADNCVMVSNPIEMLKSSCGIEWEESLHKPYEIYCPLYDDGVELSGFRSPHICSGNVCVFKNTKIAEIDKYMNLTPNIVVMDSYKNDVFSRLEGADTDSDFLVLVNHPTILKASKKCLEFATPYNKVDGNKNKTKYNMYQLAKIDDGIANNLIGQIVNASQLFNSYWFDERSKGLKLIENIKNKKNNDSISVEKVQEELTSRLNTIYDCSSKLSSLSQIEIDRSKKSFVLNVESELTKILKQCYYPEVLAELIKYRKSLGNKKSQLTNKLNNNYVGKGKKKIPMTDIELISHIEKIQPQIDEIENKIDIIKVRITEHKEKYTIIKKVDRDIKCTIIDDETKIALVNLENELEKGEILKEDYRYRYLSLTTKSKNKQVRPNFFKNVSKDKNCKFTHFDCPMDVLVDIVRKIKRATGISKIKFSDLLGFEPAGKPDRKKANNTINIAKEVRKAQQKKFTKQEGGENIDDYEVWKEYKVSIFEDAVKQIQRHTMSEATMYLMLERAYDVNNKRVYDESIIDCKKVLLDLLCASYPKIFGKCFSAKCFNKN